MCTKSVRSPISLGVFSHSIKTEDSRRFFWIWKELPCDSQSSTTGSFTSQIMARRSVRRVQMSNSCPKTFNIQGLWQHLTSKWGFFFYSLDQNFWKMKLLYSHWILLYHLQTEFTSYFINTKITLFKETPIIYSSF